MRQAFKEWAVVVDALGRGEQILILRKGGLAEAKKGFTPEYNRFWLLPTLFHQQRELVIEPAQARWDALAAQWPPPDRLRLELAADVVEWRVLESLAMARQLRGLHIWKDEVVAERFNRGPAKNLVVMAVRVSRLPQPVELPFHPEYAGCKSWVELVEEVDPTKAQPVLSDTTFARKLADFRKALDQSQPAPEARRAD